MRNRWLTTATKLLYSSDMFYVVATFSSRTAVLCLLYALSPERWHKLVTKSGMIVSILTAVAALFMVAFGCDAGSPWTQISQECNSVVGRSFLTPRRS
jgi:formate hydrogenlyase subunit 4